MGVAERKCPFRHWDFEPPPDPGARATLRVIAPDLHGYDETDKPASGYDKRNMAKDLRALIATLAYPERRDCAIKHPDQIACAQCNSSHVL